MPASGAAGGWSTGITGCGIAAAAGSGGAPGGAVGEGPRELWPASCGASDAPEVAAAACWGSGVPQVSQ
jgi:hypothetical protein